MKKILTLAVSSLIAIPVFAQAVDTTATPANPDSVAVQETVVAAPEVAPEVTEPAPVEVAPEAVADEPASPAVEEAPVAEDPAPSVSSKKEKKAKTNKPSKDRYLFNHLGIGISAGLDGIGGDIALPVGRHIQLRAGYASGFPSLIKYVSPAVHVNMSKADGDPWDINADIAGQANLGLDAARIMLDLYPSKSSGFRITAGAYFAFQPEVGLIHLQTVEPLPLGPDDRGKTGITLDREGAPSELLTTDLEGTMALDIKMGAPVSSMPWLRPYVGIGLGRVLPNKRVNFCFDLGAIYTGGFGLYGWDYSDLALGTGDAKRVQIKSTDVNALKDVIGEGNVGKISQIMGFAENLPVWPVLKFTVAVRLF